MNDGHHVVGLIVVDNFHLLAKHLRAFVDHLAHLTTDDFVVFGGATHATHSLLHHVWCFGLFDAGDLIEPTKIRIKFDWIDEQQTVW